jgi:hypothetical protein
LAVLALVVPPWVQRVVPPPIVAWREADVLGTTVPEGIAVDRVGATLALYVVDSRFNPPRIAFERDLPDGTVRWIRAGRRDGFARNEIALDVVRPRGEEAYLFTAQRRLVLTAIVRGKHLAPVALR